MAFAPPLLSGLVAGLSAGMRTTLAEQGVESAAVFRDLFDGTPEEAAELVVECGGNLGDVAVLVALWRGLEVTAEAEIRRVAHTLSPRMVVSVTDAARKRTCSPGVPKISTSLADSQSVAKRTRQDAWPTGARRGTAFEGDPRVRERAEAEVRESCEPISVVHTCR